MAECDSRSVGSDVWLHDAVILKVSDLTVFTRLSVVEPEVESVWATLSIKNPAALGVEKRVAASVVIRHRLIKYF